jgi:hypothetical protein
MDKINPAPSRRALSPAEIISLNNFNSRNKVRWDSVRCWIKKYFLLLLLAELLLAYAPAYAQTPDYSKAGVSDQIAKYLCAPNTPPASQTSYLGGLSNSIPGAATPAGAANNNGAVLFTCINQIYKFAIIVAAVIGVFFIVVAGYIYMSSDGNNESVEKAKSIIVSTVTALVILLAGFILLKALNPDLIQFHAIQPPSVSNANQTASTTGPGGVIGPAAGSAAQQLLNLNSSGKIAISSAGSCPGNNPLVDIKAIANGTLAQTDGPGTLCNQGTSSLDPAMLSALASIANKNLPITITSLTSGHHSSASDPHYAGEAVDLVPANVQSNGQAVLDALVQGGAQKVAVECTLGGVSQYILIYPSGSLTVDATKCTGQPNYHFHAQWSGTSGNLGPETN